MKKDKIELSKIFIDKKKESFTVADIWELQRLLSYHNDLYYNKEEPIISDYEYDILRDKLEYIESKHNFMSSHNFSNDIWSYKVESTFEKVKHSRPMISLGNTYNEEDLYDFDKRVKKNLHWESLQRKDFYGSEYYLLEKFESSNDGRYVLEFKFDGLGVELIYKNWELVQAITRGNWVEWEDVTQNVMQIANIPKKIAYKKHLEVRGEVVLPLSSFEAMNERAKKEWTKIFSNPRNAASGSLRMKDNSITKQRNLKFFPFDLANFDEYSDEINNKKYFEVINSLYDLGFERVDYFKKMNGISDIIHEIHNFWDVKKQIDFEIDGLVMKVNDISLWQAIGFTEHHPRYAIAYKFPAEILTTQINSVEHQVWKTGTITPVANLEPIIIGWVTVRRATLHNYEEVENLWVHIWDTVFIKRAWEVIPKIISVVQEGRSENAEEINPPKYCPSCETDVIKDGEKVRFYCPNSVDCPAQKSEKLVFAVGKQWFNIDGFWVKQVELFLELWIIHNLVDIFKVWDKVEEILELEGFKQKSVDNLISWVEKAKNVDISMFITALAIHWVGKKTAKTLAKLFHSKESLLEFPYTSEDLIKLDDIWPEIAINVYEYFNNEAHIRILTELSEILNITYYKKLEIIADGNESIYFWKKMCITWSFIWTDWVKIARDDLVKKLEAVWWEFTWSVSKNTDFLLAGEKAGSKKEKAEKLWVEVIDLVFFMNHI